MKRILSLLVGVLSSIALVNCGGKTESAASGGEQAGKEPVVTVTAESVIPANLVMINSEAEFDAALKTYAERLVLIDFNAEWCVPCKTLAKDLIPLANKHASNLVILNVDIERLPKIADRYQTDIIPLLVQIKAGK
jgi:thioredoxin 1